MKPEEVAAADVGEPGPQQGLVRRHEPSGVVPGAATAGRERKVVDDAIESLPPLATHILAAGQEAGLNAREACATEGAHKLCVLLRLRRAIARRRRRPCARSAPAV